MDVADRAEAHAGAAWHRYGSLAAAVGLELGDLVSEAAVGLLEADARYDGRGGRRPWTGQRAKGACLDAIRTAARRRPLGASWPIQGWPVQGTDTDPERLQVIRHEEDWPAPSPELPAADRAWVRLAVSGLDRTDREAASLLAAGVVSAETLARRARELLGVSQTRGAEAVAHLRLALSGRSLKEAKR